MSFYEACEYCPIFGEKRHKIIPFGNTEAEIGVVIPSFHRLSSEEAADLVVRFPDALFIGYVACMEVEDVEAAELACSILLRNEIRDFYKLLIWDSPQLKRQFGVVSETLQREDGVKISIYRDRVGSANFTEEYKRLKNG